MARPAKSTVDYFPHYIKSGKTLFVLESDFGNDGYSFWFKLLEVLGSKDGMFFDWSNSSDRRFLISKTRVDESKAIQIIETLVDVEAIDRELWEQHRIIWVQNLIDNVRDAFKKRISALPIKPVFADGNPSNEIVYAPETLDKEGFLPEETGKVKRKESKEKVLKDIPTEIQNFRSRYSESQIEYIERYLDLMRSTRVRKDISDSVLMKIYKYFHRFSVEKVEYAVRTHLDNEKFHKIKEEYTFGILRKATDEDIKKLNKSNGSKKASDMTAEEYKAYISEGVGLDE